MTATLAGVVANDNIKGYVLHEGPAYSLALNKERSHVVVAGRNVLKVFLIEQGGFKEWVNLRCGKTSSVQSSSSMDVDWNPSDDNILATATTGGAVVTWNLNRSSRNKQEHVFYDHRRTVNKVTFHAIEPNLLMSGSQDGTIKCFDLRLKEPPKTYSSDSESIRDVQFSPHNSYTFAAASENGTIQIWDTRKADKCQTKYSAHNGPVFSCDWHSELQFLATASRDKTIKVWNVTTNKPIAEYTINTTAPVGRIKWRPYRRYHLASSALVLDSAINVWDVRRPYIPYASFAKHTDVATCIAWKGDPCVLLSTNRDSTLHQNFISEADLPLENSNQHGMDINKNLEMAHCVPVNLEQLKLENKPKENSRKTSTTTSGEEELNTASTMRLFTNLSNFINDVSNSLETCAIEYKLQGKSIGELCEHNASVASKTGKHTVCLLWNILRILYDHQMSLIVLNNTIMCSSKIECSHDGGNGDDGGGNGSDEDCKKGDKINQLGDFYFGDAEIDPLSADHDQYDFMGLRMDSKTVQEIIAWSVPTGTINLRHKISHQPIIDDPYIPELAQSPSKMNNCVTSAPILQITSPAKFDAWNPSEIVVNALRYHIDQGDIQTVVSVLIVLSDETRSELTNPTRPWHLKPREIEKWWFYYLELLTKLKLWSCATTVIQLSRINSVLQLHRTSISVYLSCGLCSKGLNRNSRHCYNCCQSECARCALCQRIVKGMYAWCRGCAHGGHIKHMKQWFMENKYCPTGCGHLCEYGGT